VVSGSSESATISREYPAPGSTPGADRRHGPARRRHKRAGLRAAAADLDAVAERLDIRRLAEHAMIEFLARSHHFNSLMVPLTEMSSSSPVIRNEIEPFGSPPVSARYCKTAATLQAMPPFMSTAAARENRP
jgi:hypothetical protein